MLTKQTIRLSQIPQEHFPNKECFHRNHIPNITPANTDYHEWCDIYHEHLVNLYDIFTTNLDSRYESSKVFREHSFDEFCKLIWSSSSKYISSYV